jgi:hypothetical protein
MTSPTAAAVLVCYLLPIFVEQTLLTTIRLLGHGRSPDNHRIHHDSSQVLLAGQNS